MLTKNGEKHISGALGALRREYLIIGKTRVRSWDAWLIIGLLAGALAATVFIANRSGKFESTGAAGKETVLIIGKTARYGYFLGFSSANKSLTQSFIAPSKSIDGVNLFLSKVGNPTYPIKVSIRSSLTSTTDIVSQTIIPLVASTNRRMPNSIEVLFSTQAKLNPGSTYFLTIGIEDININSRNYYSWSADVSSAYPNGSLYIATKQASADALAMFYTTTTDAPVNLLEDIVSPAQPKNFTATAISPTQINLSWSASSDNIAVAGYNIYRNNSKIATVNGVSYSDTSLSPGTSYMYAIEAYDVVGNISPKSSSASASTLPAPDTTSPSVSFLSPANGATVSGTINIQIGATDNVGVTKVELYKDGFSSPIATFTGVPYNYSWDTTKDTNAPHSFLAKAYDAAGNSGVSTISFTASNVVATYDAKPFINSEPGLQAYYTFENNLLDSSGNNLSGAAVGAQPTFVPNEKLGGSAVVLNGSSYISIANSPKLSAPKMTISAWIKTTADQGSIADRFSSNSLTGGHGWRLGVWPGGSPYGGVFITDSSGKGNNYNPYPYGMGPKINDGIWHHIAMTADGTQGKWYVDGELAKCGESFCTFNIPGDVDESNAELKIGNGGFGLFKGSVDEVKLYSRALFAEEIKNLYVGSIKQSDTIPPFVSISSPQNGSTVSGTISITANATDNSSVAKVDFLIDGKIAGSDQTAPYSFSWNTVGEVNATRVVSARAYDAAGNSTIANISVVVSNVSSIISDSLIAHYSFDEGEGKIVSDSTGINQSGSLVGEPQWVPGESGFASDKALLFDGATNYALLPSSPVLTRNKPFSVSFWFKPATLINKDDPVGHRVFSKGVDGIGFANGDGRVEVGNPPYRLSSQNNSWQANEWYFLVYTMDGASAKLYIDGFVDTTIPLNYSIISSQNDFTIGGLPGGSFFNGAVDDVKIYAKALSQNDIDEITKGLVSNYSFEGTNNGVIADSMGSNDGIVSGSPQLVAGKIGNALKFDRGLNFVTIKNSPSLTIKDDFTLSFWFKPAKKIDISDPLSYLFLKKGELDTIGLANSDARIEINVLPPNKVFSQTRVWNPDTWYLVSLTFNKINGYKLYVNGSLEGTSPSTYSILSSASDLTIGANFNGAIDEVKIYNKELSQREIKLPYAQKKLIKIGWDAKRSGYIRDNIDSMKTAPFDGINHFVRSGTREPELLLYHLGDIAGNSIGDRSGNSLVSKLVNNPLLVAGISGQVEGGALLFDGATNYASVTNLDSVISGNHPFTMAFWFKPTATINPSDAKSHTMTGKNEFYTIGTANYDGRIQVNGNGFALFSKTNEWKAGNWYYASLSFDPSAGYKLYVNGVLEGSAQSPYSILSPAGNLIIGASPSQTSWFPGAIDEFKIFGKALNGEEILAEFNDFSYKISLSDLVFSSHKLTLEEVRTEINNFKATQGKIPEIFVNIASAGSPPPDVFDAEYSTVVNNFKVVAQAAKEAGFTGLMLDQEEYQWPNYTVWDSNKVKYASSKTREEYKDQMYLRGKEIITAVNSVFPNIKIINFYCFTPPNKPNESDYRLYIPFCDGLIAGADSGTKIIEATEDAYPWKEVSDFVNGKRRIESEAKLLSRNPLKLNTNFEIGYGIWMDFGSSYCPPQSGCWQQNVESGNLHLNSWTPADWQKVVTNALNYSDSYVWVYSERLDWWTNMNLPQAYVDATKAARNAITPN